MELIELIQQHVSSESQIHDYFGYREDWVKIPLEGHLHQNWMIIGGEGPGGMVVYSDSPLTLKRVKAGTEICNGRIYTQRHLPKWVYRTNEHTMVAVDTQTDGNKFLMIFDNKRECKDEAIRQAFTEEWG